MEKFTTLTGKFAHIPIANIDTDMIIPKQYLKTIKRSGLGEYLFAEQRYNDDGSPIADFALNANPDSKILIAGENFGCGSSREHAPWALLDFGIRAIIAPGFADIFYNNCFKNGILPIAAPQKEIDHLLQSSQELHIDLAQQKISSGNIVVEFDIDPARKEILLEGLDDIERALRHREKITAFENTYYTRNPWLKKA